MTRTFLLLVLLLVLVLPTGASTAFDSPIFESPVWDGSYAVITMQQCSIYMLPTVRIGDPTE